MGKPGYSVGYSDRSGGDAPDSVAAVVLEGRTKVPGISAVVVISASGGGLVMGDYSHAGWC